MSIFSISWRKCPTETAEYKALTLCKFLQLQNQTLYIFKYLHIEFSIFTEITFHCSRSPALMHVLFVHWINPCRNVFVLEIKGFEEQIYFETAEVRMEGITVLMG